MLNSEFVRQVTVDRLTDGIPLDRLEEISKAEQAGTLIILPCKIGDTVYVADYWGKKVQDFIINFITYDGEKTLYWERRDLQPITPDIWGKTVFLTKEAAGNALKGLIL